LKGAQAQWPTYFCCFMRGVALVLWKAFRDDGLCLDAEQISELYLRGLGGADRHIRPTSQSPCIIQLNPPCSSATFVVNSEPHAGARPFVCGARAGSLCSYKLPSPKFFDCAFLLIYRKIESVCLIIQWEFISTRFRSASAGVLDLKRLA
jgi:hypothetical protein